MLRGLFSRGGPRDGTDAARVKALARGILGQEIEFMASEIDCGDPSCPGLETVILVLRPGDKTRAVKLAMPMAAVTEEALRAALLELNLGPVS